MRRISGLFGALILTIGVVSCGGGGTAPAICPANTFCMGSSTFFLADGTTTLSVAANTAVTWANNSATAHNVTFDVPTTALAVGTGAAGTFDAPVNSSNQRQFAVSGSSHPFHCTIHPTTMHGTVNVQ
jgi:Copper binding proteins, plastocyanin/azurin family